MTKALARKATPERLVIKPVKKNVHTVGNWNVIPKTLKPIQTKQVGGS